MDEKLGLLPPSFYLRPVAQVARDLLGSVIRHGQVALRITEVEAYGGLEDSASHCRFGVTPRNAPMWEEGGLAYVYCCYGIHLMLNVVTGPSGDGAAVLVRAGEPLEGLELMQSRRGVPQGEALLAGPGRVAQALGLSLGHSGSRLWVPGGIELHRGERPGALLAGPRVGIGYAKAEDRQALLRFALAGTPWVSHPRGLQPWVASPAHDCAPGSGEQSRQF